MAMVLNPRKQNPGGVVDGDQNTVPAGARDEVPAGRPSGTTVPPTSPSASDLLVVGGVAQTREAILAAHRPTLAGTECRACGHVYAGVRVCPAAAEVLEGCPSLIASGPAPADRVEIVHVACGRRPRRSSGRWAWVLTVLAVLLVAGQTVSMFLPLPAPVHLVVAVATPVCVWRLAVVVRRLSRREREARRGDALGPLV